MRFGRSLLGTLSLALGACSVVYGDKLSRLDSEQVDGGASPDAPLDAPADGAAAADAGCDACAGVVVVGDLKQPGAVAVDDANVYWIEEGYAPMRVRACALGGCVAPVELGVGTSTGIATDGAFVYWADVPSGVLSACHTAGCSLSPTVIATGQDQIEGPVFDGTELAWSTSLTGGAVRACTASSCAAPAVLATNQGFVVWLAAQGGTVAWSTTTGIQACKGGGCGGAPTILAASSRVPVAIGANVVVWPRDDGTVVAHPVSDGAETVLGRTPKPTSLTTDGVTAYWYDDQDGAIYGAPLDGTAAAPVALARGVKQARQGAGLVARGPWLYVATATAIRKVAR